MSFKEKFIMNFIADDRWKLLLSGLGNTIKIAVCALILGLIIGLIIAIIRVIHDTADKQKPFSIGRLCSNVLNIFARIYLTVIRGTPILIQLMIIYYVIFASSNNKIMVAALAFGINSGAYVAEIFRSGIMSIDKGQMEAGRSLGLGYLQTMWYIILPQAVKNVLPAMGNELIVLLKETSVAGYIAIPELVRAGDIIRSRTFEAFMPLFAVALIYLCIVMILQAAVSKLERRLARSDRR